MKSSIKIFLVLLMGVALISMSCVSTHAMICIFEGFAARGFAANVPAGWYATEDKLNNKFEFNSPDGSITMGRMDDKYELITFLYVSREGHDGASFTRELTSYLNGTEPVFNEHGNYEFTYTKDDVEIKVQTRHIEHVGVVMESLDSFDDIFVIIDSLR